MRRASIELLSALYRTHYISSIKRYRRQRTVSIIAPATSSPVGPTNAPSGVRPSACPRRSSYRRRRERRLGARRMQWRRINGGHLARDRNVPARMSLRLRARSASSNSSSSSPSIPSRQVPDSPTGAQRCAGHRRFVSTPCPCNPSQRSVPSQCRSEGRFVGSGQDVQRSARASRVRGCPPGVSRSAVVLSVRIQQWAPTWKALNKHDMS